LKSLREQTERFGPETQAEIENRLKRAEDLRQTAPEKAQTMLRGFIEYYQDKPSAAEAVAKARQALAEPIRSPKSEIQNKSQ
jgi:hypothetical protein